MLAISLLMGLGHAFRPLRPYSSSVAKGKSSLTMDSDSSPPVVADFVVSSVMNQLGGKVIVSGIGEQGDDEFMLNLLNEQVRNASKDESAINIL